MTNKQRQRELARAKWERQHERRSRIATRRRRVSIVVGVLVGLAITVALVWLVLHIVKQENNREPQTPLTPTDSFNTNYLTPSTDTAKPSTEPTPKATETKGN